MSADPGGRAARLKWLAAVSGPGLPAFRAAGRRRTGAVAAATAGWGAAAYALGGLEHGGQHTRIVLALGGMGLAAGARAAALASERRHAGQGAESVASALRTSVLANSLAADCAAAPRLSGEATAHAAIELVDQVATYHRRTRPARYAVAPSCGLVLAVIAAVQWPVALMLLLATPLLPVNLRLAGMATEDANRAQLDEVRALSQQLMDRFRGMRTLVTLGAVQRERDVVERACDRLNRATAVVLRRAFIVAGVLDAVVTFAIAVCATYVGLLLLGYIHVSWAPHLTLTGGLLVLVLCPVFFAPLREYVAGYHERDEALAAVPTLSELADPLDPPVHDFAEVPISGAVLGPLAAPAAVTASPRIELRNVSVVMPGARSVVLRDITADLPAAAVTVITAPSGEGKTTLLRAIAGLTTPGQGTIGLVDPDNGETSATRPGLASWMGQQTFLLPGTLAENIALGDPAASRTRITRAADQAGLASLLARLPAGLDTPLGEGGWGISAGQARRVALARAVLRDAGFWLLDEPTAHLDLHAEEELVNTLLNTASGRTVVIATHSPLLIRCADLVLAIEDGDLITVADRRRVETA